MTVSVRRVVLGALAALALAAPPSVGAQRPAPVDPATAATIRRLLELTGAAKLALQSMEQMMPSQRAANPQVPVTFWDAFLAHARRDVPQLVDSLIPVYAARFTKADLVELVRFYESPLGRRLSAAQPMVTQESMQVGQRWGARIGGEVGDSLARAAATKP